MPPNHNTNSHTRTRTRSSSGALAYSQNDSARNNRNQHHTPLIHHVSAVHHPTPPIRPASIAQAGTESLGGMSAATRYAHNLKVLRRRDPSILRIFDQFSHVCVYHHNGERWEKKGYEGSMFLYERADYPPYGFYILNRMGMDDYIQRLWPEDNVGVHGNYLMLRTWPEWSRNRVDRVEALMGAQYESRDPFDMRYKWDGEDIPDESRATPQTIGLWMFATDVREPMIDVMLRLHSYIKQNVPYPEEFRYGPDKPPPPNPHAPTVNGAPLRTPSAASVTSTGSGVSAVSSPHTGSVSASSSQPRSQRHSPNVGYINPLLYQVTDSTSVSSTHPLEPVVETPVSVTKSKTRKRKGKGGREVTESGEATPLVNGGSQISNLDTLFAKLTLPNPASSSSSSTATATASGLSPPAGRGTSLLETIMGSVPSQPLTDSAITASNSSLSPPSASSSSAKVTLESLFASARATPAQNNEAPVTPKRKNKTKPKAQPTGIATVGGMLKMDESKRGENELLGGGRPPVAEGVAGSGPANTGLTLLNDIFASATSVTGSGATSTTFALPPSYADSFEDEVDDGFSEPPTEDISEPEFAPADTVDEPEAIEIHSPRPRAPLSLASMFDAAAAGDDAPSSEDAPASVSGLGLENMDQGTASQRQVKLTPDVMELLLGKGGSMQSGLLGTSDVTRRKQNGSEGSRRHAPLTSASNIHLKGQDTQAKVDNPEEVRKKLLSMIGLGAQAQSQLQAAQVVNGEITPRVAASASKGSGQTSSRPPISTRSSEAASAFPSHHYAHNLNAPHATSDQANGQEDSFDEDFDDVDDDEEAILELDFSDTRALSDLRVFEDRERVLREQMIERKVASRNVSRSATPAIPAPSQAESSVKPPVVKATMNGALELNGTRSTVPAILSRSSDDAPAAENKKSSVVSVPTPATRSTLPQATGTTPILSKSTSANKAIPSKSPANPTVTTAVIPSSPPPRYDAAPGPTVPASSAADATPSPSKKKIRRGRGRGREKERADSKESSPAPPVADESVNVEHGVSAVEFPTPPAPAAPKSGDISILVSEVMGKRKKVETVKADEGSKDRSTATSISSTSTKVVEDKAEAQIEPPELTSKAQDSLASALDFLKADGTKVKNKKVLADIVVRLLQTDAGFVDQLWNAWDSKKGESSAFTVNGTSEASATHPPSPPPIPIATKPDVQPEPEIKAELFSPMPEEANSTGVAEQLKPEVPKTVRMASTQSAPALLPSNITDGQTAGEMEDVAESSPELESTDAIEVSVPPMVKDVVSVEADQEASADVNAGVTVAEIGAEEAAMQEAMEAERQMVESML